jgi:hypothetical protein
MMLACAAALAGMPSSGAFAVDNSLRADPFVFVGTAPGCAPTPPGSNIVTSAWLGGMGLPDNLAPNTQAQTPDDPGSPVNPATTVAARDPHTGLLLNKNGPTSDCSSAGARIKGFQSGRRLNQIGFDIRNGTHCGAGAPRFNIISTAGDTYFAGCAAAAQSPAPQDPAEWTRVTITGAPGQVFPAGAGPTFVFGPNGTQVKSISIIFDEGTNAPSTQDPNGVGLAVIDNIRINGRVIRTGIGIEPKPRGFVKGFDKDDCKKGGWQLFTGIDEPGPFKNQGQCVSFFARQHHDDDDDND